MVTKAPEFEDDNFDCPHCGAFAHQTWATLQYAGRDGDYVMNDDPASGYGQGTSSTWSASRCFSCRHFALWRGKKLIYPASAGAFDPPHPLMTSAAAEIYREAVAVLPISRRAAAALARAAMESELRFLLEDSSSNLHALIGKLGDRVSTSLWKSLTVLRDTGNKALHESDSAGVVAMLLDESDAELAPFLLSAVNQIVDEMVARPKQSEELYDLLPAGVREAAERQRAQHVEAKKD